MASVHEPNYSPPYQQNRDIQQFFKHINYCIASAQYLRQENIPIILNISGKIGKRVQKANLQNAKYAIFIGDNEQMTENFKITDFDQKQE